MKYLVLVGILTGLWLASAAAWGAERLVLITTPPGYGASEEVARQLASWQRTGAVSQVQLFESQPEEQSTFQLFGIVSFSDDALLQAWKHSHSSAIPEDVVVAEVDVLASLGNLSQAPTDFVFVMMQYDVLVDRPEFEDYIDGYQLAEMVVRESDGGLVAYTSYFAHADSVAPWQSLIIMEYRDEAALADSKAVNKALGEELMKRDPRFASFKRTKDHIRTKTGTTLARAVLRLP